jgi:hypothetical protein
MIGGRQGGRRRLCRGAAICDTAARCDPVRVPFFRAPRFPPASPAAVRPVPAARRRPTGRGWRRRCGGSSWSLSRRPCDTSLTLRLKDVMPATCRAPRRARATAPGPVVRSAARPSMPAWSRATPASSPARLCRCARTVAGGAIGREALGRRMVASGARIKLNPTRRAHTRLVAVPDLRPMRICCICECNPTT